jgi:hypothetical protein
MHLEHAVGLDEKVLARGVVVGAVDAYRLRERALQCTRRCQYNRASDQRWMETSEREKQGSVMTSGMRIHHPTAAVSRCPAAEQRARHTRPRPGARWPPPPGAIHTLL